MLLFQIVILIRVLKEIISRIKKIEIMGKLIAIFFIFCVSLFTTNSIAQESNTFTEHVNGKGQVNGGIYSYKATLKTKLYASGFGEYDVKMGIMEYEITGYTYKGVDAATLEGVRFPLTIKNIQSDVEGSISIKESKQGVLAFEHFRLGAVQQGQLDNVTLNDDNIKQITNYVNGDNSKLKQLTVDLNNITLKNDYFEELATIRNLIDNKLKGDKQIEEINKQISNLDDNSKANVIKKISLYENLQTLDSEKSYTSEISRLNDLLNDFEKQELEEKAKDEVSTNSTVTKTEKSSTENTTEKQKIEQASNTSKTTVNRMATYNRLKQEEAKLGTLQYSGQVEAQKKLIKDLRQGAINEARVNGNYALEQQLLQEEKNEQLSNNISTVTNDFANAVNEGIISHLELTYGFYENEESDKLMPSLMSTYELGIGFRESNLTLSMFFGAPDEPSYAENYEAFLIGGAVDVCFLNILGEGDQPLKLGFSDGRKYLIKGYAGLEYALPYSIDYVRDGDDYSISGDFTGIRLTGVLFNFVIFRYSFGTNSGESTINGNDYTETFDLSYSKVSLGLQINF